MKDQQVLQQIRNGDESALKDLYKKYYRMMVSMVMRNNGTEEEAKDIFQDALIVFWQKARDDNFQLTSKISTFLYSICQNLWRKELERKRRLSYDETKEDIEEIDYEEQEKLNIVQSVIAGMGEICRKVLTYYYFDRMRMEEIAERLNFANADTAKTKKYKCKQELDRKIRNIYESSDFLD